MPHPAQQDDQRSWRRLLGGGRRLVGLGVLFLWIGVVVVASMLWQLRQETLREAQLTVGKLGIAVAEQTARSVQAADVVLKTIQQEIVESRLNSIEAFRAELGTQLVQRSLALRTSGLPQVDALTIVDAEGRLVNFSRRWPVPSMELSDRDYTQYFRAGGQAPHFVSAPVRNRDSGKWTIYIARRVDSPAGALLGMVLVALDLGYFQDFYRALNTGTETMVTLCGPDGSDLTDLPQSPARPAAPEPHPGARLVSVHSLSDHNLSVMVSIAEVDALAGWRRMALLVTIGTVVAILCVGFLLRSLLMQFERQALSEASLAERNDVLEATRSHMEQQTAELSASRGQLAEQSAALQAALAHMNQGIIMVAADHTVALWNQRAIDMLDLPADLLAARPKFDALAAWQRAQGEFSASENHPVYRIGYGTIVTEPQTYERKRPNGRILEVHTIPMSDGGMVRTYTDITDRRTAEEQIRYFAHHDSLTKLGNRMEFRQRLDEAIALARRSGLSTAVLYLDLDGFKLVNDTHGHETGDKLLVEVAARLQDVVRSIDTVARMGGDEFAVIQTLVDHPSAAERLAERIQAVVREPCGLSGVRCSVDVSIGIALSPEHAADAESLLRDADIALYRAKASGKGTYRMFDTGIDRRQQRMFMIEQDLRQALAGQQFFLEYQPIVDMTTLATVRYEALLRWRHPVEGVVAPGEFIGLAEKSGLIVPIGAWAMEQACSEAASWPESIEVAVNLSPAQFTDRTLPAQVAGVLARTGIAPGRLHLEVTEGLMLDDTSAVLGAMAALRATGVRFSLDDFGTAHAGLTYLRRFPFDSIKIDRSFVQDAPSEQESRAIVAAILAMGQAFGLTVIAEGVETEAQLALMREMGCGQVQGYLLGRPGKVPAAQALAASPASA